LGFFSLSKARKNVFPLVETQLAAFLEKQINRSLEAV